jgi:hypothetical protein
MTRRLVPFLVCLTVACGSPGRPSAPAPAPHPVEPAPTALIEPAAALIEPAAALIEPAPAPAPTVDHCAGRAAPAVDLGFACATAGTGAWIVELDAVRRVRCEEVCSNAEGDYDPNATASVGRYRIAWLRPDGTTVPSGAWMRFRNEGAAGVELFALAVYDYDGDGAAELVVKSIFTGIESVETSSRMLTMRGNRVATYSAAVAFERSIASASDPDHDGRPDLVALAPYGAGPQYTDNLGAAPSGPYTLHHALPDGTFTTRHATSRAFHADACAEGRDDLLVPRGDRDEEPEVAITRAHTAIACALLLGAAEAEVRARIEAQWASLCAQTERCSNDLDTLRARVRSVAATMARER